MYIKPPGLEGQQDYRTHDGGPGVKPTCTDLVWTPLHIRFTCACRSATFALCCTPMLARVVEARASQEEPKPVNDSRQLNARPTEPGTAVTTEAAAPPERRRGPLKREERGQGVLSRVPGSPASSDVRSVRSFVTKQTLLFLPHIRSFFPSADLPAMVRASA